VKKSKQNGAATTGAAVPTLKQRHNKALHPSVYSFARSSLRFWRQVSLVVGLLSSLVRVLEPSCLVGFRSSTIVDLVGWIDEGTPTTSHLNDFVILAIDSLISMLSTAAHLHRFMELVSSAMAWEH